ncbi:MAG TPA: asparagine synthase (glutamine-hydrolyzing), partial [Bacteroidales bacterium]
MCGICGIIAFDQAKRYETHVGTMTSSMAHRGPDAEGIWGNDHLILGHRRLSIIDLSADGTQPMISNDQRYVLVFNGEIYNFREIKYELKNYAFRTRTDSEVILAAYSEWGKSCVEHFNGMFAFAIWDNVKNELFLVRDRLGIKPIYYFMDDEKFIFSSEIRTILASNLVSREIDQTSLVDYARYQTVHAPDTIIKNIKMIMPGQYVVVQNPKFKTWDTDQTDFVSTHSKTNLYSSDRCVIQSGYYWQLGKNYSYPLSPEGKTKKEIQGDLLELMTRAIERRLIADVPFGAFLSGGIDSSIVVGLMASVLYKPVNTFSITFKEKKYSEAPYSQLIAK